MRLEPTTPVAAEAADAAKQKQIILAVHELLVRQLTGMHGESLKVERPDCVVEGNHGYEFDDADSRCTAMVTPCNERAAAVVVTARLGRLYREFRRAVRWLAVNRAGNSVGLCYRDEFAARRELWLASNRVTLPDDEQGIREMLLDVRSELTHALVGLNCHFSHLVSGARLAATEEFIEREQSKGMAAILACPRGFVDALEADPDLLQHVGLSLAIQAAGWVCDWQKQLKWIDQALASDGDARPGAEERIALLGCKLGALARLSRHEECLALADQLENESDQSQEENLAAARCHALYGLGRYDDLLETVRSATLDGNPRVWFWRSVAHAQLGHVEEALEHFNTYESKIGTDIVARKQLEKVLPPQEPPKPEDPPGPDLEIKL
jgi:tetratricopeptide (TPR) repeat protein